MSDGPASRPIVVDVRSIVGAAVVVLAVALVWVARDLVVPLVFAGLLTLVGAPGVAWLKERYGVPRAIGAGAFLVAALGALSLLVLLVLPRVIDDLDALVHRVPALFARVEELLGAAVERAGTPGGRFSDLLARELDDFFSSSTGKGAMRSGASSVFAGLAAAVGAAGRTLLIPVLTFFFLTDLPSLGRFARQLTPDAYRARVVKGAHRVGDALGHMLRGQLVVALVMAVLYGVGLQVSGVPFAFGIGLIAGFGYFVPFASGSLALALSMTFVLLEPDAEFLVPLVGASVTSAVVQGLEAWVFTPRVVGSRVGLPPTAVVLAVLLGGALFGFAGVVLALPVATVFAALYQELWGDDDDDDAHGADSAAPEGDGRDDADGVT